MFSFFLVISINFYESWETIPKNPVKSHDGSYLQIPQILDMFIFPLVFWFK